MMVRAWTTRQRFSHHGRFWHFEDIVVEPPPAQKPHPPLWVAAGSEQSIRRAAARGFNLILDQYAGAGQIAERIGFYKAERKAQGFGFDPMQVAVARQLYVANDAADKQAALERQAAYTQRTVDVSRKPAGKGGSHVLAYADKAGGTEENALYGTPDEICENLAALQKAGMAYVLLTVAGGSAQLRRFAARSCRPSPVPRPWPTRRNDRAMAGPLKPRDAAEVEQAIRSALADGKALEVVGHGTKRAIGRAAQWDATLDLSTLTGVTLYEPEELVLSARAGTPLAEIEALVAASKQELAFEPMDYGPLLGSSPGAATIGGVLAANLSGPRRIKAGAARDHFLGFTAVSGRGETFKSGGRVVKNVTGYDLCKLIAGSWGTLAAMTDVTIKTLPRAETEATVLALKLDDATAGKAMTAATGSFADVSAAAHLPAIAAARIAEIAAAQTAVTAFRLEGVAPSVAERKTVLEKLLAPFGALGSLGEAASRTLWRAVRDVTPFAAAGPASTRDLWRISTAPTHGADVGRALTEKADAELFYDWAGGLVWAALPAANDAHAPLLRATVAAAGGHSTLIRAPAAVRATVDVFTPEAPALAALTARVRAGFDPQGVLNAGRMWAGV